MESNASAVAVFYDHMRSAADEAELAYNGKR